jgi:phosphatidate cytidylyltransferase
MDPISVTCGTLILGGLASSTTGSPVVRARFRTWVAAAPLVLVPLLLLGPWGAVALAAGLGAVAAAELAEITGLPRRDAYVLGLAVALLPLALHFDPLTAVLGLALLTPLLAGLAPLLGGDSVAGSRRAVVVAGGVIWIGGGLAGLVLLEPAIAVAVCLGVAIADVGAWCAGRAFGTLPPGGPGRVRRALARPLSPLSPAKTWAGVVGAAAGGLGVLALLGQLSVGLGVAVVAGSVLGDLLESMVKRGAGVKDAGTWLPGFGGLLDRIDSLIVALPVAVLVSAAAVFGGAA